MSVAESAVAAIEAVDGLVFTPGTVPDLLCKCLCWFVIKKPTCMYRPFMTSPFQSLTKWRGELMQKNCFEGAHTVDRVIIFFKYFDQRMGDLFMFDHRLSEFLMFRSQIALLVDRSTGPRTTEIYREMALASSTLTPRSCDLTTTAVVCLASTRPRAASTPVVVRSLPGFMPR